MKNSSSDFMMCIADIFIHHSKQSKRESRRGDKMFGSMIRYFSTKPKPNMKPIELKTSPDQTQTITRVIFDILKEHGPLTIGYTWERVKNVARRLEAVHSMGRELALKARCIHSKYECMKPWRQSINVQGVLGNAIYLKRLNVPEEALFLKSLVV
ncbi:hypothetical protein J1N35_003423 [Gossypium stocksii]|uniref:Uncharacterized protein n=1 Tax=Gossypium stocksii TaxID=47602 RepID=A0A9D3WBS1_9ROSI|nr:hypothetical protein J1N35_003423 [Gossypium stocksii]